MIGVSLPLDWLISGEGSLGDRKAVLDTLKHEGVKSIELRTVRPKYCADEVKKVADLLWNNGFSVTVHGDMKSAGTAVDDLFLPLRELLKSLRQPTLNITVHPINGDNAAALTAVSDYITENRLAVTVSLENNRLLPDKTEGDSTELVLSIVKAVDRKNVGICFDMGHFMYYVLKNRPDVPDILPDKEFLRRVTHTHIHALNGLKTHFPLGRYELPIKRLFDALSFGYFGVYNLELDLPRFEGICEPLTGLKESVRELKANMPVCAALYDEVRESFDGWMTSALGALDGERGTKFGLIHSSSYLFNTNGFKWGMDVAFRNAGKLASAPQRAAELLKDLELMIVSHGHGDHFEQSTVKDLCKTDMKWLIPDFLIDTALSYGISRDKMLIAHEGEQLKVGALTVLPFKGRHFRPGTTKGVEEYGYYITADNSPSLAFPVDVRDFSTEDMPDIPRADYCFAHVWLGDGAGFDDDYTPLDRQFAEFVLRLSDKNILLCHLYEDGRKDRDMWRDRHAEIIKQRISELSPKTNVVIPKRGEVIKLG